MRRLRALLPLCCPLAVACVNGNGVPATRSFDVFGAEAATHRTFIDLEVRMGARAELAITCDENLLDDFRVRVAGPTLVIDDDGRALNPRVDCRGHLELPALTALENRGSGRVDVYDAFPETRSVALRGSGRVRLRAPVRGLNRLHLEGSGDLEVASAEGCEIEILAEGSGSTHVGQVEAGELAPCSARIELSGSGDVAVGPLIAPAVAVRAGGSGSIHLDGRSGDLQVRSTGSGDVRALGLETVRGDLESQGSGTIEATVTDSLRVRLRGSGDAVVGGNPPLRDVVASGSGKLRLL